jgi:hypothetical protein
MGRLLPGGRLRLAATAAVVAGHGSCRPSRVVVIPLCERRTYIAGLTMKLGCDLGALRLLRTPLRHQI